MENEIINEETKIESGNSDSDKAVVVSSVPEGVQFDPRVFAPSPAQKIPPQRKPGQLPKWAVVIVLHTVILGLLFCIAFVAGIIAGINERNVSYSDIVYQRPDFDKLCGDVDALREMIEKNNVGYNKQLDGLITYINVYYTLQEMTLYSRIEFSKDTTGMYAEEVEFIETGSVIYQQKVNALYIACANSPHAARFEEDFFGEGFLDQYVGQAGYSPALMELMTKEAELINQYYSLYYSEDLAMIIYNGKSANAFELMDNAGSEEEYQEILGIYYETIAYKLGDIFVDLVVTRKDMAKELGYAHYLDYAYSTYGMNITVKDAQSYTLKFVEYIVPVYIQNMDILRQATLANGYLSKEHMLELFQQTIDRMPSAVSDAFEYMHKREMYYLSTSEKSAQECYTTYFYKYEAPFMYCYMEEQLDDYLNFAHEFGHYLDFYINYGRDMGLIYQEGCSQGMTYLAAIGLSDKFSSEKSKIQELLIADTMSIYINSAQMAAFELELYNLTEVSIESISQLFAETYSDFGMSNNVEGDFYRYLWAAQSFFFTEAGYAISYCMSNDVALQFCAAELDKEGKGVEMFLEYIDYDIECTSYEDILEDIDMDVPYSGELLPTAANVLQKLFDFVK